MLEGPMTVQWIAKRNSANKADATSDNVMSLENSQSNKKRAIANDSAY